MSTDARLGRPSVAATAPVGVPWNGAPTPYPLAVGAPMEKASVR